MSTKIYTLKDGRKVKAVKDKPAIGQMNACLECEFVDEPCSQVMIMEGLPKCTDPEYIHFVKVEDEK
jgi:hypothetical protein